tara:strand:- start:62 stop:661 length:600 start_codon:yes stop_codon:yes gene_type:complete
MINLGYLKRKIILLIILTFFQFSAEAKQPIKFVEDLVNEATYILSSNEDKDEKIKKLQIIAKNSVDIKGIGLYTLGKYRKTITDEQKIKYNKLFEVYFLKSFASRLVEYNDAQINIISEDIKNEKYTIVYSKLIATAERPEIKIDWRVYTKDPDKPLIRDLIIEDLSLARTQKEEFKSVIENNEGELEALFENLRNFIN